MTVTIFHPTPLRMMPIHVFHTLSQHSTAKQPLVKYTPLHIDAENHHMSAIVFRNEKKKKKKKYKQARRIRTSKMLCVCVWHGSDDVNLPTVVWPVLQHKIFHICFYRIFHSACRAMYHRMPFSFRMRNGNINIIYYILLRLYCAALHSRLNTLKTQHTEDSTHCSAHNIYYTLEKSDQFITRYLLK